MLTKKYYHSIIVSDNALKWILMLRQEVIEKKLDRVQGWIKAADEKVSIFLAFQGVVVSLLFSSVFSWTKENVKNLPCASRLFFITGVVLVGYSLYKSISAIIPRLAKKGTKKSLTFFGDIAQFDLKDFKKAVENASENDYTEELIEQVHTCSGVAARKHGQFRDAIWTFIGGLIFLVTAYLFSKI